MISITSSMTSRGHGAPATIPVRSVMVLYSLCSSTLSNLMNMVGTPWQMVIPSRSIIWRASSGSKPMVGTMVAALTAARVMPRMEPKAWEKGTGTRMRSSLVMRSTRSTSMALEVMFRCVSMAPLGFPVVPEVYRMKATSSTPLTRMASWKDRESFQPRPHWRRLW